MRKLTRTIAVLFIAACFLIPAASAVIGDTNEEKITGQNKPKEDESVTYITTSEEMEDCRLPQLEAYRQNRARTRADHDLEFDLDATPKYTDLGDGFWQIMYMDNQDNLAFYWGASGHIMTYSPVINNAGNVRIDTFTLRLVVTYAEWDEANEYWTVEGQEELINTSRSIGPLEANTNTTTAGLDTRIAWKPLSGMRVRMGLRIEYGQDPDHGNDRLYYWPFIFTDFNTLETQAEQGKWDRGQGWSVENLAANDDANPEHHTAPTVLEASTTSTGYATYSMNFANTREDRFPFLNGGTEGKGAFIGLLFSGSAAMSSWTFEIYNTTSQAWENELTGAQGISDGWYSYRSTDDDQNPTYYLLRTYTLNDDYMGNGAKFRAKGTNLYLDDYWISTIEVGDAEAVQPPDPDPMIPELKFELNAKEDDGFSDNNGNSIIDQEWAPGNEYEWNFTIKNTASTSKDPFWDHALGATISKVEFKNLTKPEGWDVTLVDQTGLSLKPGQQKNVTMTVEIPEDARSTGYFLVDDNGKNPYIISFDATATPTVTDPAPVPGLAHVYDTKVETIVPDHIGIKVTVDEDNKTGIQGAKHDYTITIENTGNCNLTEDINAEIAIEVTNDPPGLWSVNLDGETLEIDYDDSDEVTVSITSPINEKAGYFESEITITIEEFDIEEKIILTTGVDQVFGLELDFKDRNDNAHEVDPTQSHQLFKPITFEITNNGNGEDVARFEVTTENKEDEDWFEMEEDTITLEPVGGLHAEEDFVIEFNIPEDALEGDHIFTVKAVSDKDEDTETGEREITFTILRPDLTVSAMFDLEPEEPILGEETLISARIFNNGTTTATSFSVYLYITVEGGNEELVGYQLVNILQKGQLMDLPPFEYVFDEFKEYTIRVEVDPKGVLENGNVTEMDETNNEAQKTIMVIAPDLEFKKEEVLIEAGLDTLILNEEGNFDLGKIKDQTEYTVTITVKNDGDSDASKVQVNLKIMYLDGDQYEMKEIEDNVTIDSIKAGKTGSATFTWIPLLWNTQYTFELTIDPEDKIPESSEKNNDWTPPELFVTPKKPKADGPGFELIFLVLAIALVGAVFYRKRK